MTPKNIDLIKDPEGPFLRAFHDKGRVSNMLLTIPIYAVMEEDLGQRGAHLVAYQDFLIVIASHSDQHSLDIRKQFNDSTWLYKAVYPTVTIALFAALVWNRYKR